MIKVFYSQYVLIIIQLFLISPTLVIISLEFKSLASRLLMRVKSQFTIFIPEINSEATPFYGDYNVYLYGVLIHLLAIALLNRPIHAAYETT